tara:strand:+ start:472 stop:1206 length:735 start_codon:yes stop_codon:yes gene_type:complete
MASVREVYNALSDLANKDERGFVTPTEFNSFAPIAQQTIFNKLFTELTNVEAMRKRNIDPGRDKSRGKQIKEDLAVFSSQNNITKSSGSFAKPDDFARLISIKTFGDVLLDVTSSVMIDAVYDEEKIDRILLSTLSAPTRTKPVALVRDTVTVFPTSINRITMRYYKQPEGLNTSTGARTVSLPTFGFTISNGKEAYNAAASVDFELPEHYTSDLVIEMAKLIGVNLRDRDVYAYATAEQPVKR